MGIVAGGPYWCAKADAYDFITWYWGPIFRATGACMNGPRSDLNLDAFIAKANAKAASGDIDPIQNLSRQKIYIFHGYNDKLVAREQPMPLQTSIATISARPIAATFLPDDGWRRSLARRFAETGRRRTQWLQRQ